MIAYKVGDKVRLNPRCGIDFTKDEARLDVIYKVVTTCWTREFGEFVKLEGLKAGYKIEWLLPVYIER